MHHALPGCIRERGVGGGGSGHIIMIVRGQGLKMCRQIRFEM